MRDMRSWPRSRGILASHLAGARSDYFHRQAIEKSTSWQTPISPARHPTPGQPTHDAPTPRPQPPNTPHKRPPGLITPAPNHFHTTPTPSTTPRSSPHPPPAHPTPDHAAPSSPLAQLTPRPPHAHPTHTHTQLTPRPPHPQPHHAAPSSLHAQPRRAQQSHPGQPDLRSSSATHTRPHPTRSTPRSSLDTPGHARPTRDTRLLRDANWTSTRNPTRSSNPAHVTSASRHPSTSPPPAAPLSAPRPSVQPAQRTGHPARHTPRTNQPPGDSAHLAAANPTRCTPRTTARSHTCASALSSSGRRRHRPSAGRPLCLVDGQAWDLPLLCALGSVPWII